MAKKIWWKSSKGQAAIREAARSDAAGAMKVGPATSSTGDASLGNTLGMRVLRGPLTNYPTKVISQGPSTGFGSFKTGTDVNQYGRAAVVKDEALF